MIGILFRLVVKISDGDTLKARCGDSGHYGLMAIDAPESRQPW